MTTQIPKLDAVRQSIRQHYLADENTCLQSLVDAGDFSEDSRKAMAVGAAQLVSQVRQSGDKSLMDVFMAEYGLSTEEGVALMCLAEALLRVPDVETISALIEDKITPFEWKQHLGQAQSALVNASTWGLLLTAKILDAPQDTIQGTLQGLVKRFGEPVIRKAVSQAMKELGRQFVLGQTIKEAVKEGRTWQNKGYTYSFDMLGEAARNEQDAQRHFLSYADAISELAPQCTHINITENPGISVKLSALYSRYEPLNKKAVMEVLVARTLSLALLAKSANMGFNIDAEEADRLDLSLDVIEAVLSEAALVGWAGFGVVVQTYNQRAPFVIDWLNELSIKLDRKIMVRLVKGAYWDAEVKRAQTLGLDGFPVFTRKAASDISWIVCAKKLFDMQDRIYPQFATHNAHSMAAILEMAPNNAQYEFQRLHGMGEVLHDTVVTAHNVNCRVYAPVGSHEDLLAYLVRRLLENGANSSFVNQIADPTVPADVLGADPFEQVPAIIAHVHHRGIRHPAELFGSERKNAKGFDVTDTLAFDELQQTMQPHKSQFYSFGDSELNGKILDVVNPANPDDLVGKVIEASTDQIHHALDQLTGENSLVRADICNALRKTADLFEENHAELFSLLQREAGKTILDAIAELREAVDFLRYYADQAEERSGGEQALGIVACISPWNFPLAIFIGQIAAALAVGNRVVAKPAEQTPLVALKAIELMREAGVPESQFQLLVGDGAAIGAVLLSDDRVKGVCFTGSTETAQIINKQMAEYLHPEAMLVAETGGQNAMMVDSTALPEQVVRDVLASGFQSAGQRCSALRMLYLQEDIADKVLTMLKGAMEGLVIGDPLNPATDVGPVIDEEAQQIIQQHIKKWQEKGAVLKQLAAPEQGHFVEPTLISVGGISELEKEVFGPVVHVATFKASEYEQVIRDINATGYGLTFCLHSRLDDRIARTCRQVHAGNIYVNRNQIGAIVGSQPFGGEGLSGTGPKAGGPNYLSLFVQNAQCTQIKAEGELVESVTMQGALNALPINNDTAFKSIDLPGPTGETNRLSLYGRGRYIVLGSDAALLANEVSAVLSCEGSVLVIGNQLSDNTELKALAEMEQVTLIEGKIDLKILEELTGFSGVISGLSSEENRTIRIALAQRTGLIIPLITDTAKSSRLFGERLVSIDTTATGGNATLLAAKE